MQLMILHLEKFFFGWYRIIKGFKLNFPIIELFFRAFTFVLVVLTASSTTADFLTERKTADKRKFLFFFFFFFFFGGMKYAIHSAMRLIRFIILNWQTSITF